MAAIMYAASGDGDLIELKETLFTKEVDLQDFLTKHPALLAGDQMNPSDPRRFVLITAEAGIAISEGAADYFSLDHLFIDQDGIPTLVEVKRSTDTRARREVVGQLLEYAANACAFWHVSKLRQAFEQRCASAGLLPNDELGKLGIETDGDLGAIWDKVDRNLKEERLRLVFLSDKFGPDTQRLVEFLNRQMEKSEAYAVEVPQYTGGGLRTLVPRVLNPSVIQADRRAATTSRGELWTIDRFFDDLASRQGPEPVSVFKDILIWAQSQPKLAIFFGRGKSDGSIQITFKKGGDPSIYQTGDAVVMTLWSYGRAEIEFQYLVTHAPFTDDEKRKELWRRLNSGTDFKIPEEKTDKRPSINWRELVKPDALNTLLKSMEWVIGQLDGGRVQA